MGLNSVSLVLSPSLMPPGAKAEFGSQPAEYQPIAVRLHEYVIHRWEEFVAWVAQSREALSAWLSSYQEPSLEGEIIYRRLVTKAPGDSLPIENMEPIACYPLLRVPQKKRRAASLLVMRGLNLPILGGLQRQASQVIQLLSSLPLQRVVIVPRRVLGHSPAPRAIENFPTPKVEPVQGVSPSLSMPLIPFPMTCQLFNDRLWGSRLQDPVLGEVKIVGGFIREHAQEFEYLRLLPQELRSIVALAFDKKNPGPLGKTWAELSVIDSNTHPEALSLPLSHLYLVGLGLHPLKQVHFFLDIDDSSMDLLLESLRLACKRYHNKWWNRPFERTLVHELLCRLPYVGALEFISHTHLYRERNTLLFERGQIPSELAIIEAWLPLSLKLEVLPLSFTLISKRFNKFVGHVDPIPPYLVPLLPFESNGGDWEAGLADPQRVAKALEIADELGKVDLCLRLPVEIVDPLLKQGGLLADLVYRYRKLAAKQHASATPDPTRQPIEPQKESWKRVKFPKVPPFLLPVILRGGSLEEVLQDPQRLQVALDLLRQVEFLELLTYLPPEVTEAFSLCHGFSPGCAWSGVVAQSRKALEQQGGHTLTPALAQELLYLDPKRPLDECTLIRWGRAPHAALCHARYLSQRIEEDTAEALERSLQTHHYVPLSVGERKLLEESIDFLLGIGGMFAIAKATVQGALLAKKVHDYLAGKKFAFNQNCFAWLHAGMQYFSCHSVESRYQIYLNLHQLFFSALDKVNMIPRKQQMVQEMREHAAPKREVIRHHVERISEDLLNRLSSYSEHVQTSSGKTTLKTFWDWFQKDAEQHEPFFGTASLYGYRALTHFLFPDGVDDTLSLDQIIVRDPKTGEYRYNFKEVVGFVTQTASRIVQQHLGRYPMYEQSHLDITQLSKSFSPLHSLLRRQEALSQADLVEAIVLITENTIDYLVRLLEGSSDLRQEEEANIIERKNRMVVLQKDQNDLMRRFDEALAIQDKIIEDNSSWKPWVTLTSEQKDKQAKAERQREALIAQRNMEREGIAKKMESLSHQIEIIQRHGIPEMFDVFAAVLGLPRSVLQ